VKILVDVDWTDGCHIIMAPVGDLDPEQIREVQRALERRKIILVAPIRKEEELWERNLRSLSR
jgi:hypothetical protein